MILLLRLLLWLGLLAMVVWLFPTVPVVHTQWFGQTLGAWAYAADVCVTAVLLGLLVFPQEGTSAVRTLWRAIVKRR